MTDEDRYGKAIGIWKIDIGGADIEVEPSVSDFREFRKILSNDSNRKDKTNLFNDFEKFMVGLISRKYPNEPRQRQEEYVAMYTIPLFEEALISFRLAKKDDLEKAKAEALKDDLKKLISSN